MPFVPAKKSTSDRRQLRSRKRFTALPALIFGCAFFFGLSACSTVEDPEDPGFNEPAVTGVLRGDISTVKGYRDAVEKENRRAGRDGPRWNDGFNDEDFRD